MLRDISIFLEKVNTKKLKTIVFVDYEVKSLAEAETGTYDLTFVIDDGEERYMATVNLNGTLAELSSYVSSGLPITVHTENTSNHTGLDGDDYVLYYGEIIPLEDLLED